MSLHGHVLLSFFIIISSCVACYGNLQEDPFNRIYVDDSPSIDDDGIFKKIIKQSTDVLSSKKFAKFGCTYPSLKTVNVIDYGAKGNGYDDTEVHTYSASPYGFEYPCTLINIHFCLLKNINFFHSIINFHYQLMCINLVFLLFSYHLLCGAISGIQEGLGSSMFLWGCSSCDSWGELSTQTNEILWPLQIWHHSSG